MEIENCFLYPQPIKNLIDLFTKLPGIGPRQAARFVFHLLKETEIARAISQELASINERIIFCKNCFRTIDKENNALGLCSLCRDEKRDTAQIAIVEKESDLQNFEKTGAYKGRYHVLDGVLSPLDSDSPRKLHLRALYERIETTLKQSGGKCEVILATNTTTQGDMTALYIDRILAPLKEKYPQCIITRLGRGLSLGSELEYADEITLKSALTNRR